MTKMLSPSGSTKALGNYRNKSILQSYPQPERKLISSKTQANLSVPKIALKVQPIQEFPRKRMISSQSGREIK